MASSNNVSINIVITQLQFFILAATIVHKWINQNQFYILPCLIMEYKVFFPSPLQVASKKTRKGMYFGITKIRIVVNTMFYLMQHCDLKTYLYICGHWIHQGTIIPMEKLQFLGSACKISNLLGSQTLSWLREWVEFLDCIISHSADSHL